MSAASHQKQSYSRATQVVKVQFHRFYPSGGTRQFRALPFYCAAPALDKISLFKSTTCCRGQDSHEGFNMIREPNNFGAVTMIETLEMDAIGSDEPPCNPGRTLANRSFVRNLIK